MNEELLIKLITEEVYNLLTSVLEFNTLGEIRTLANDTAVNIVSNYKKQNVKSAKLTSEASYHEE